MGQVGKGLDGGMLENEKRLEIGIYFAVVCMDDTRLCAGNAGEP